MFEILLVEDNDLDAELIKTWVKAIGNISRVTNIRDFTSALEQKKFDVILADYQLSTFTALDVMRVVHTNWPNIPVIVVSGTISDAIGTELLKFKAADYILKDRPHRMVYSIQKACQDKHELEQKFRNQRIENIGALAMGIIHDLNNVLAPVLTVLGMIEDDLPATKRSLVKTAQNSVMRGADMLKQILMFIRGMNGHFSQTDVMPVIRQVLIFLKEMFPKNISVANRIESRLPIIRGNATQINQILINFCVNARDAIVQANKPDKKILIVVNVIELNNFQPFTSEDIISGKFLNIEVHDTGTGMDADVMEKIFHPYFTTKNADSGTGLGLSTSLALATAHGGYVDVSSQKDVGSTFRLLLPVSPVTVVNPVDDTPQNPPGKGETILLVEDEQVFQKILNLMLSSYNYDVITASDGAEALGIYYEPPRKIDLVITDMMMPIMTGADLILKLREKNSEAKIICMTGTGSRSEDLIPLKPNAAVNKPCNTSQMLTVIRNVLENKPE